MFSKLQRFSAQFKKNAFRVRFCLAEESAKGQNGLCQQRHGLPGEVSRSDAGYKPPRKDRRSVGRSDTTERRRNNGNRTAECGTPKTNGERSPRSRAQAWAFWGVSVWVLEKAMGYRIILSDLAKLGCVTFSEQAEKRICVPREFPSMIRVLDRCADTIPCPPPSDVQQQEASW